MLPTVYVCGVCVWRIRALGHDVDACRMPRIWYPPAQEKGEASKMDSISPKQPLLGGASPRLFPSKSPKTCVSFKGGDRRRTRLERALGISRRSRRIGKERLPRLAERHRMLGAALFRLSLVDKYLDRLISAAATSAGGQVEPSVVIETPRHVYRIGGRRDKEGEEGAETLVFHVSRDTRTPATDMPTLHHLYTYLRTEIGASSEATVYLLTQESPQSARGDLSVFSHRNLCRAGGRPRG